jgi:hypothetical protein
MLVPAVAGIDHRGLRFGRHARGCAILVMANNDGIAQAGDHRRAVFKRFPGSHIRAGRRHVLHPDRMAAEGDRGDLETDPCPGARLKEQKSNRLSAKPQRRRNSDLVGLRQLAEVVDIVDAQGPGAQQVAEMAGPGLPGGTWRSLSGEFACRLKRRVRHIPLRFQLQHASN